ncbi:PMU1-high copy suppressor of ts tps2 mutant phenotype [Fusarium beomiforme]|uniref:PMU1-high copy suppressor of ts tps2 mutant phenotype n=1 Tax=Fusarium beomiforme TaxID=44412 RepID=A0A9P5ARX8_9HYPO|nr:PMU1-high copy suppressor of ts tps2 mutant phenotype [Fusarium beomiforme]
MKLTTVSALLALAPPALADWHFAKNKEIKYTSVEGFFMQDDLATNPTGFDYAQWNFGLLNRTYPTDPKNPRKGYKTQWERFEQYVKHLNRNASRDKTRYKCYWGLQSGNGTATWEDAELTPAGEAEAYKANAYFKTRFEDEGMPYFDSYYASPLARCVQTAVDTFQSLKLPKDKPFAPMVKEKLREGISIRTCDHRRSKSFIKTLAKKITFEKGFSDKDKLWTGKKGETDEHQLVRSKEVLDDIFTSDNGVWISISSHSGEITKLLQALNHRPFRLATGQIIPVLVRADVVSEEPTSTYVSWTAEATCNAPPATSIGGQGCVCSTTLASSPAKAT